MKIFGFQIQRAERRASKSDSESAWLGGAGSNSAAGVSVTPDSALQATAVYGCVRILAETLGMIPLNVFKRGENNSRSKATDHPLHKLLHDSPNERQTSIEFREMLMGHLALRGNAYAQIIFAKNGSVMELRPIHPDHIELKVLDEMRWFYSYRSPISNKNFNLRSDEVLHLKGVSLDGWTGLSPIDTLRDVVGTTMAADEHSARFFGNNARPGGVLTYPTKLNAKELQNLRESWERVHNGPQNSNKVAILEGGLKWESVSMTNEQSQFLQNRQFQITEIARIFRIPPHMIGDLTKSSFSNIEQQSQEFVTYTMMPWFVRWEQAILKSLFSEKEQQTFFAEFNTNALLRGDTTARGQYYQLARVNGWMNIDEIRELENMNPLPDGLGQTYMQPLNMKTLGEDDPSPSTEPTVEPSTEPTDPEDSTTTPDATQSRAMKAAATVLFEDLIGRIVRKEQKAIQSGAKRENFIEWKQEQFAKNELMLRDNLRPAVNLYLSQIRELAIRSNATCIAEDIMPEITEKCLIRIGTQYLADEERDIKRLASQSLSIIEAACFQIHVRRVEQEKKPSALPTINLESPPTEVTVVIDKPKTQVTVREMDFKRDDTGRIVGAKLREIVQ